MGYGTSAKLCIARSGQDNFLSALCSLADVEIHVNGADAVNHDVNLYVDGVLRSSRSYYYPIPLPIVDVALIRLRQQYTAAKGAVCDLEIENVVTVGTCTYLCMSAV